MGEREGRNFTGKNRTTPRHGVVVISHDNGDGTSRGDVEFRSETYGVVDELMAKGKALQLRRKGKDTTIIFHENSEWLK